MRTKILILILGILIATVIITGSWLAFFGLKVEIFIDKTEYEQGETLKLSIKNNLAENICFSSCYPYSLEKQDGRWKSYSYGECLEPDLNKPCLDSGQAKAFEIVLSSVEEGVHRIVIPICIGCQIGKEFKESERFYSNEFTIK